MLNRLINILAISIVLCGTIHADVGDTVQEHGNAADIVKVFTVASSLTDGYQRYIRSASFYNIQVETLGMGAAWQGGDMNGVGGGYKVNLLKKAVKPLVVDEDVIVLFTDGYDVVFTESLDDILEKFHRTGARVLFGAEHYIWPDTTLKHLYPASEGARFLNSGMFIGYATELYEILKTPIKNTDDDQLFYTHAYLDEKMREKLKIQLDHTSNIFQNLNGAISETSLQYNENGEAMLINTAHQTRASVVHGNGPSKLTLNNYGNYLAGAFANERCMICDDNTIVLNDEELPAITIAIFIEKATPFMEEFFDSILTIDYPKKRINVFMHNAIEFHADVVNKFVDHFGTEYAGVKTILPADNVDEKTARNLALAHTQNRKSDYMFVIDSEARLDNINTLKELLRRNRTVISPKMTRPGEVWSNFWGALNEDGYYARAHDYMDIAKDKIRGIWNVPYITNCYLVKNSVLHLIDYSDETIDAEMAFARQLRNHDIFMYTINLDGYGHLVNSDSFSTLLARPDFYQMLSNRLDWETRYIHAEYAELLKPNVTYKEPCTDVYWFPIVTEQFCEDLIAIMENFGKWSDGTNQDERIGGGYEAVPTRDIHMSQVGLEPMWLKFLQMYVRPLQEAVYLGYFHNPPRAIMNFVVRYRPTEQPYLKPHHDSSTYTINIALNRAGIDYSGGGCRFLRYDCSVRDTKVGHMLMHPGRLTHFHEGMHTTNGTRYIMISFIDP